MSAPVQRAILFRFHKEFDVCRGRIALLRRLNPGLPVYGMYGGGPEGLPEAAKLPLDDFYEVPSEDSHWKWRNGDLCVRLWFKDRGRSFDFDVLHLVEWDLLILDPLEQVFAHVNDGVGLTAIRPIADMIKEDWEWVTQTMGSWEWKKLNEFVRAELGWEGESFGAAFPAASFSRVFLERYAAIRPPGYCNDEVRVPLFALAFGMTLHDTGIQYGPYFDCDGNAVDEAALRRGIAEGVRAFHPVYFPVDPASLV